MKIDTFSTVQFVTKRSNLAAAFVASAEKIFKEDEGSDKIQPVKLTKQGSDWEYMPWGADNEIPFKILDKIEEDETINTCQQHNIKNCYAAGLEYTIPEGTDEKIVKAVRKFCRRNNLASYYLGVCTDMKFWQFAVTVITFDRAGEKIVSITRKQAMYCRFSPKTAKTQYVYYAQWRGNMNPEKVYRYRLLNPDDPWGDLEMHLGKSAENNHRSSGVKTFALVTRMPTPDNTYYPIPYYASLFKGKWYDIKQLIAIGKYSKLKNAAPLKYIVQIDNDFWDRQFDQAGITSEDEKATFVKKKKEEIINFLTGMENAGRAIFSGFYIDPSSGKEVPDIKITNLETGKEGGDWETDIQEAINMVCFVMGVHSNLVGSVPGKSQSNNSGSDKRELYMIAQLLNKPTHDLLIQPHQLICDFNGWEDVEPQCKIMQLTTLDEHKDIKQTNDQGKDNNDGDNRE